MRVRSIAYAASDTHASDTHASDTHARDMTCGENASSKNGARYFPPCAYWFESNRVYAIVISLARPSVLIIAALSESERVSCNYNSVTKHDLNIITVSAFFSK